MTRMWGQYGAKAMLAAGTVALTVLGREALGCWREADLHGQMALVTGSSRGLGHFLLALFKGLFPGTTVRILSLVNRLVLPPANGADSAATSDAEIRERSRSAILDGLTAWGRNVAQRFHQ